MSDLLLAIDQGTTGTTVLVVTPQGQILGRGYNEHPQIFPQPGWVEHDAEKIWQSVLDSTKAALADAETSAAQIAAIGITNQRETVVAWSKETKKALENAIVWQDRRTAAYCAKLRADGVDIRVREIAGLPLDPYFSATKIAWLLENSDSARAAAANGDLRIGTIDSWLVYRLSGGACHATDASNAARTMLFDIHRGEWSEELLQQFGVEREWLGDVVASAGEIAHTNPADFLDISAPISGMAGDQQSALFGQACLDEGQAKATYGTGAFVLVNSGANAPTTDKLIATTAWRYDSTDTYALEGSVFTAGASVQWLRDGAEFFPKAPDVEDLAASVPDSGGVVLVPAFAGIGAPIWDADARAAILGVTRGTTRAHVARATLEAVAFRVRQVVDAMREQGTDVKELRVDGGMAANNLLMQMQADILGVSVTRPVNIETTSLGAAFLAALGSGIHTSLSDVSESWQAERTFEPNADTSEYFDTQFERFNAAVAAVRGFAANA